MEQTNDQRTDKGRETTTEVPPWEIQQDKQTNTEQANEYRTDKRTETATDVPLGSTEQRNEDGTDKRTLNK